MGGTLCNCEAGENRTRDLTDNRAETADGGVRW
jgi:hypothetical protein